MFSVRGAITIENDNIDEVLFSTKELIKKILQMNLICKDDIISIIFSCTKDIKSAYPAQAARDIGITYAGLLCLTEMYVERSMEKCIRILMLVNGEKSQNSVKHIYLKDAVKLRPDINYNLQDFNKIY